jgi:hypothetical protein
VPACRAPGDEAKAEEALQRCWFRIRRLRAQDAWLPDLDYAEGVVTVLEGDVDRGITLLKKAAKRGWLADPVMSVDPKLEPVHATEDFESLVADADRSIRPNR